MLSLLDNQYVPTTLSIGFLKAPLDVVQNAAYEWIRSLRFRTVMHPLNTDLAKLLSALEPLTQLRTKELFIATTSDWTAYFDNGIHGTDTASPIGYLSRRLECQGLAIQHIENTIKRTSTGWQGMYGGTTFTLYASGPREWLNVERSVSVINDDPWRFATTGRPLEFEEVERYSARKIRDRFTKEMLDRYCRALGLRPFEADFYEQRGVIIEFHNQATATATRASFAEARRIIRYMA